MKARARAAQLDVIDLGMGNPDGATPRPVVNKLIEAARNPRNHRYSTSRGIPRLREEIVKRYATKYGVELNPDTEAIVTIGAKDALAHLLFAVVGPGDIVASPNPAYPIHQYGVMMAEGQACMLPLSDPADFLGRVEELCRTPGSKPKVLLISFPHNPTTTCVDLEFFREIIRIAREHGILVVHDFAYADICFDGYQAPSILQVEGAKDVAIEIYSLSKSFNMAGWRVGFCLGNPKMIAALARIKSYLDYGVFQPVQIASIIALRECEEDTRKIACTYQKRRDLLVKGLARAGWPVESPQRLHVPVGAHSGALPRPGIARILETANGKGPGGRIAGDRLRPPRGRSRALRAGGKRASHPPELRKSIRQIFTEEGLMWGGHSWPPPGFRPARRLESRGRPEGLPRNYLTRQPHRAGQLHGAGFHAVGPARFPAPGHRCSPPR